MAYTCKLYADGLSKTFSFDTLLSAEIWACKHARVFHGIRYDVTIFDEFENIIKIILGVQ